MALVSSKRYLWMLSKVCEGFSIGESEVQKCFEEHSKKITAFLSDLTVPPKLFFFYQPVQQRQPELVASAGISFFFILCCLHYILYHLFICICTWLT
jgi:hypothetical protein